MTEACTSPLFKINDGSAANGLSLRDAILIANANPNTEYEIHLTGGLTYTLTANEIIRPLARIMMYG